MAAIEATERARGQAPPVEADARRERMVAALRGNDAYGFLQLAEGYLDDQADDAEAVEWTARTYAALGLNGAARRVLAREGVGAALRSRLESEIPGHEPRVAWSALRERFDANLRVFEARSGLRGWVEQHWRRAASDLHLLQCADGGVQVYCRGGGRSGLAAGWLPALAAHGVTGDAAAMRKSWDKRLIAPPAVCGLGLGHLARTLIEATRETFLDFSAPVLLIERSPLAWAVAMHLHDWREAFAQQRVIICAGDDALSRFAEAVGDPDMHVPTLVPGGHAWPGAIPQARVAEVIQTAAAARKQSQRDLHLRVAGSFASRDRAFWARRFAEAGRAGPPLTVLGVTSRFTTVLQYTMRDLLAAFEGLGCGTELVMERDASSYFSPIRTLRRIEKTRPDLIVTIDHLQAEYEDVYPPGVPGVCWIQDHLPHLFRAEAGRGVRPLEFVIGHGFPQTVSRFDYPADRFMPCTIPTNPHQMVDAEERAADLAPYACDVMFATNASTPPERLHAEYRERFDASARPFVDAAYEALQEAMSPQDFDGDYDFGALLERVESRVGVRITDAGVRSDFATGLLRSVADVTLRERVIRAVADWADRTGRRFHLYGRGWEQRPEFARFATGVVKHGPELGRAFRAAAISLHAGCNSLLHQRVLDGLCAGGFFLLPDKTSDTMHETSMAVYRYLVEHNPPLPMLMKAELLPAPHDENYRRMLRVRGLDPDAGRVLDEQQALSLRYHGDRGRMPMAGGYWPQLDRVTYRGAANLIERIEHYLANEQERRALAAEMRQVVLDNFTYEALARRTLEFIANGLGGQGGDR